MIRDQPGDAWVVREYVKGRRQVDIARDTGLSQAQVCVRIARFCEALGYPVQGLYYDRYRKAAASAAMVRYQGEITPPLRESFDYKYRMMYANARHEHVWLLRAEGLTLQQIGDRMGVSRERARGMIHKFGRRMKRATRKTRFKILTTEGGCDGHHS